MLGEGGRMCVGVYGKVEGGSGVGMDEGEMGRIEMLMRGSVGGGEIDYL